MSKDYQVKVFTRENACNKADIWNAFRTRGGFRMVALPELKSIVGANAPRVMLKAERIETVTHKGQECLRLTKAGEAWVKKGTIAFLRNHEDRRGEVNHVTKAMLTEAS
jgi:hypothetical protein